MYTTWTESVPASKPVLDKDIMGKNVLIVYLIVKNLSLSDKELQAIGPLWDFCAPISVVVEF